MTGDTFGQPVVATHGTTDPAAPLVVLLHGRGSHEQEILGLAAHLPAGPAYAAVRAPIAEGGGFAWFANRGIGRPLAGSLRSTMDWFRTWLDGVATPGRPVLLVGFSGGAAFAGGLANLPVFVGQGDADHVIPRELLDRTWTWLLSESGAPTVAHRTPGGHQLTVDTVHRLGEWITHRLGFLTQHDAVPAGPAAAPVAWPTLPDGVLPARRGPRPEVSWTIPQQQADQTSPEHLQEALLVAVRDLPGVDVGPSQISVPGARAFTLPTGTAGTSDADAFLVPQAGEFAHLHPSYDGSLHLALPPALAADVSTAGWGRPHMWAGTRLSPGFVMVHGPRDDDELAVVLGIVAASHAYASGRLPVDTGS